MRTKRPPIVESADSLLQRMKQEKDVKKRQRLQALSIAASGYASSRQDIASLRGVPRHTVAAWLKAYAEGGIDTMVRYQISRPPLRQRITPSALAALHERLRRPRGFAGSTQSRTW
jgi:transposase